MNKMSTSIIIANYNGAEFLPTCLKSLLITTSKIKEIIIVDDGSTDSSLEIIKGFQKKYRLIKLIKNKSNLGAAASRNKAIKIAKGEIVVFLDNDTELEIDSISNLLTPFTKDNSIGATQSLLVDFEKRDIIQNGGGLLVPQVGWLAPYYQKQNIHKVKVVEKRIIAISACLAVKKDVLLKIKGFDEKLAVYTEDLDLSWRLWVAGFKIVLAYNSIVYHWTKSVNKRQTMNVTFENIYFHLAKNSFTSMLKNYELINVIRFLPLSILINIGRGFYILFKKQKLYAITAVVKALLWVLSNRNEIYRDRERLKKIRKYSDSELFETIFSQESLITNFKKYFL